MKTLSGTPSPVVGSPLIDLVGISPPVSGQQIVVGNLLQPRLLLVPGLGLPR